MVFYAHLQLSLEVTQLDLTGIWEHHRHAPVSRFIPAQMDAQACCVQPFRGSSEVTCPLLFVI